MLGRPFLDFVGRRRGESSAAQVLRVPSNGSVADFRRMEKLAQEEGASLVWRATGLASM